MRPLRRPSLKHMNWYQRPKNFRSYRKLEKQTYTEFVREKEMLFDRWYLSKEIAQYFSKLHQLVLIEEFNGCLPTNIKTYIEEQKAESMQQAARLADYYSLTHRGSFEGSIVDSSSASVVKTDLAQSSTTLTFL